jgi:hypothetical protein
MQAEAMNINKAPTLKNKIFNCSHNGKKEKARDYLYNKSVKVISKVIIISFSQGWAYNSFYQSN